MTDKAYIIMGDVDAGNDENRNFSIIAYRDEAEATRIVKRLNELKVWKKQTVARDGQGRPIYERGRPKKVEPVYEEYDPDARARTLAKALYDLIPCPHDDEGDWGEWIGMTYLSFSIETVILR